MLAVVGGKTATARHGFSLLRIDGYLSEKSPHKLRRSYPEDGEAGFDLRDPSNSMDTKGLAGLFPQVRMDVTPVTPSGLGFRRTR